MVDLVLRDIDPDQLTTDITAKVTSALIPLLTDSLSRPKSREEMAEWLGVIQSDRGRFKVRSPKTEKSGKAERIVLLFPELLDELNALFTLAEPGVSCPADSFVISQYRNWETNYGTTLLRIMDRAGVERWLKPFMALRASRRTELERTGRFPNHVLNNWFGHSGAIAETHYLRVTEDDFIEAIGPRDGLEGQTEGQSLGQQEAPAATRTRKNPGETGDLVTADRSRREQKYTLVDSDPLTPALSKRVHTGLEGQSEGQLASRRTEQEAELLGLWARMNETAKANLMAVAHGLVSMTKAKG